MARKKLFEQFITANLDYAYRFAFSYTKNREEAEDVVGESVVKALKAVDSLKDEAKMKPWFSHILVNTALNRLKADRLTASLDDGDTPEPSMTEEFSQLEFESLLNDLDENYRPIIIMRFLEDMKISEIAEILDINENTVKTRLYKALSLLRGQLS